MLTSWYGLRREPGVAVLYSLVLITGAKLTSSTGNLGFLIWFPCALVDGIVFCWEESAIEVGVGFWNAYWYSGEN